VDRYGRKLARDDTAKQLEKFYQFDEGSEESDREEADDISTSDNEEVLTEPKNVEERGYDPARDGGFSASSSEDSSSDEEEEEEEDIDEIEFPSRESDKMPLGEVTHRIAVVNLDWDNIRAEDLMAVFSSFMPTGGRILKASVYPSEFGKGRMEKEEMEGPPKEIFASRRNPDQAHSDSDDGEEANSDELRDEDEEDEKVKELMLKEDKGDEFNSTQLRRYQLERLRYFYAIIEFSSKEVAKRVYDAVDGTEYLSTANFFDLRFVPEETDFSDDTPREECDELPDGYQPNDFVTDALQHSRVKLTWDADDNVRKKAQGKAFKGGKKEIDENDIKAYLGTDSSDNENDQTTGGVGEASDSNLPKKESERQRMRALLGLSDQITKPKAGGPVGDMEITFTSGLAGEPTGDSVFENEPEREETTKEKYIRKERERRQRRKEKLKSTKQGAVDSVTDKDMGPVEEAAENDRLGFDDTFFSDPGEEQRMAAKRKEEKRQKREQRAADTAASAAQRSELELLMVDDKNTGIKHFNMNEIEKAEKRARKKGKKGMRREDAAPVDDFKVNVSDPRFERLYESHEFAIDPTNPKFKATSAMRALLEEGRKRRSRDEYSEAIAEDAGGSQTKKQKKASLRMESGNEGWKKPVSKVKRKSQKV
jgi:NUC153 domain